MKSELNMDSMCNAFMFVSFILKLISYRNQPRRMFALTVPNTMDAKALPWGRFVLLRDNLKLLDKIDMVTSTYLLVFDFI